VEGLDKFEGSQLFYRVKNPADFAGKNLVIVGGGDSALDWALNFVKEGPHKAESVILIHRRDGFKAAPASVARMKELCDAYEMQFIVGQVTGFEEKDGKLTGAKVTGSDGITRVVPLDVMLVFFGLSPKLGPIAEWGLDIERKQLKVDTEKFSTSVPGIFAVGDINVYPGKKKLILSGFHECALAAFGAAPFIFPEKKIHLQYTTTSPKLHKVLGVESPVFDGAEKSAHMAQNLRVVEDFCSRLDVLPYTPKAAAHYGSIRASLERTGQPIGVNDLHIAAHARSEGLILVTNNEREFSKVPALQLENWVA
jgi:thioredoxin reductase (NADPH)